MAYQVTSLDSLRRAWLLNSNIPTRFLGVEPSDLEVNKGKLFPEVESWLNMVTAGKIIKAVGGLGVTGVGLLFDGDGGIGKTTYSTMVLAELVRRMDEETSKKVFKYSSSDFGRACRPIYFLTIPELLHRKKAIIDAEPDTKGDMVLEMDGLYGRSAMDHLNVRVLVIDDLGKEQRTDYTVAAVDDLIRSRYDKALPTIVTTNIDRDNMGRVYGEAMGSFVFEAFNRVLIGKMNWRENK